jgi:hypothetical protein
LSKKGKYIGIESYTKKEKHIAQKIFKK